MIQSLILIVCCLVLSCLVTPSQARVNFLKWFSPSKSESKRQAKQPTPTSKLYSPPPPMQENVCDGRECYVNEEQQRKYTTYRESPSQDLYIVYYHSKRIDIEANKINSVEDIIAAAIDVFGESKIGKAVTYIGFPIRELSDIPEDRRIVVLNENELFMFPALKVGDVVDVQTSDRVVSVKTLSTDPKIFEWDHFMSDEECEHIIKRAKKEKMVVSTVGAEIAHAQTTEQRTSKQFWVGPGQRNDDDVFERVRARAAEILRISTDLAEDTQLVLYAPDQHYYGHHDYSQLYDSNPYYKAGGNRFVTVLYYLNDVTNGGETLFPYANSTKTPETTPIRYGNVAQDRLFCTHGPGLRVQPRRGRAVMFYNLKEDKQQEGVGDPATYHIGCDPKKDSEKWLSNQWFRNKRVKVNGKMHLYDENW